MIHAAKVTRVAQRLVLATFLLISNNSHWGIASRQSQGVSIGHLEQVS